MILNSSLDVVTLLGSLSRGETPEMIILGIEMCAQTIDIITLSMAQTQSLGIPLTCSHPESRVRKSALPRPGSDATSDFASACLPRGLNFGYKQPEP